MLDFLEDSSGLVEELEVCGAAFAGARFETVRAQRDRIAREAVEQSAP